jgi:hypothetical protein
MQILFNKIYTYACKNREIANQIASATMLLNQQKGVVLGGMTANFQGTPLPPPLAPPPVKKPLDLSIRLDEMGRAIDSSGRVVE